MILKVFLLSLSSAVYLFLLTKIMGEKQMSQISLFDYITSITIGSIAAEMATNMDWNPINGIISMSVYALLAVSISYLTQKSLSMRKFLAGMPVILMRNGQIVRASFKKSHMDLSEFLMLARIAGYYNIDEVDTAIMEANGAVSFLPVEKNRALTPSDMNIKPEQKTIALPVIMDGRINKSCLTAINKTEEWLLGQIKAQGYKKPGDVFLAVCDNKSRLSIFAN